MPIRFLLLVISLLFSRAAQAAGDDLELVSQLARAGSPQLALRQVESIQPAQNDAPGWLAWEKLRLSLLMNLGRAEEVLPRVERLPAGLPQEFQREAYLSAAQAALKLNQGARARAYLARLLWQLEPGAEMAQLRRLVLESYLVEQRAADAYLVQLRYQQDQPPDKAVLGRVVESMLEAGMAREAATWLPQLDEGALKLLLRLEAGLLAPEAALAEAGRAAQKKPDALHWRVRLRAALTQGHAAGAQEAREQLLNRATLPPTGLLHMNAQSVWQAYTDLAQDVANRASLLIGDDASWLEQASRATPVHGRALLAYLSANARDAGQAAVAQTRLVASLRDARLELAALRLFGKEDISRMAPDTRHLLGELAADMSRHAEAARYWRGLDMPPAGMELRPWQLKRASIFVHAAALEDAADALHKLLGDAAPLPAGQAHAVLQLLLEMQEAGAGRQVESLLTRLLPLAPAFQHKDILFALGDSAQQAARHETAASAFIQSAMLAGERDPLAQTARLKAAVSLARAGLKEDARLQYQLLLKAARDPAQQGAIRRALSKL